MENLDNMGANTLQNLSRNNLTDAGRKKLTREIVSAMISLCCLGVGLFYTYILKGPYAIVPRLLYVVAFLIEGVPIIVTGVKGIFTQDLTNAMEILVGIAIIASALNQQLILALLIPLILNMVHLLEERSIMGGRDVIEGLKNMQQDTAILYENGQEQVVDAKALKKGQIIHVKPGSGIPIDGVVTVGESHVDEKSLTGEPEPSHVRPGDPVYAGTVNLDGTLTVEIRKEYVDTSFSRILGLLEKSESMSIPESRIVDRFLVYYIPFVLSIAAAVALTTRDVSKAIAILVVSCPCGQMLASPAPMIAALSAATKRGILIKSSQFLESLTEIGTVVFDKTGTITNGVLAMTKAEPYGDAAEETLLTCARSVAASSTHPASKAIMAAPGPEETLSCTSVREVSGSGMEGTCPEGIIRLGRLEWIEGCGCAIPEDFRTETYGSVSYVSLDHRLLGRVCFSDTIRSNAGACIEELRSLGVQKAVMLTGDREEPAAEIARQAGLDRYFAKLLPEDKLRCLHELGPESGKVLSVGDGINDALILREADVGIAMGAMGSDLAIESADIALMNNNLQNIPYVLELAVRTRNIIYQNLMLSICTSVVMIFLSAFGIVTAISGSLLHNLGAFLVLINSSRILREDRIQGEQKQAAPEKDPE